MGSVVLQLEGQRVFLRGTGRRRIAPSSCKVKSPERGAACRPAEGRCSGHKELEQRERRRWRGRRFRRAHPRGTVSPARRCRNRTRARFGVRSYLATPPRLPAPVDRSHRPAQVERSYIEDGFNLYGLRTFFPGNFQECLDLILDRVGACPRLSSSRFITPPIPIHPTALTSASARRDHERQRAGSRRRRYRTRRYHRRHTNR